MSTNCQELPKIYDLAKDVGVNMWRLNRFHSSKNDLERFKNIDNLESRICQINDFLSCSPKQMKEVFEYLSSVSPKEKNYAIPDPLFRTYVNGKGVSKGSPCGKIAFRIKTNGDVTPNVFTDDFSGNVFKKKLIDILCDSSFYKFKFHLPKGKCVNCVNYEYCQGGDITDSYLLSNDLFAPDPFCFLNPKEKKQVSLINFENTRFVHETYLGTIYIPIIN
jgi:radical SAM protein with 4Fe4S-binding SPASM domain